MQSGSVHTHVPMINTFVLIKAFVRISQLDGQKKKLSLLIVYLLNDVENVSMTLVKVASRAYT